LAEKCGKNVDFYLRMWKSPRFWRFFAASVIRMEQPDILFSLGANSELNRGAGAAKRTSDASDAQEFGRGLRIDSLRAIRQSGFLGWKFPLAS
jgi:hypothetical protein